MGHCYKNLNYISCSSGEEANDDLRHSAKEEANQQTSNADLNFFKRSKSMCFVPEAESNPFEVGYQLLIIKILYTFYKYV